MNQSLKNRIKKIVREFVGMPEHFKNKKYLESIDHLYADPIADQILKECQKETKRAVERVRLDREELSDLEHQQWMSWTKWIYNQFCEYAIEGKHLLVEDLVERWKKNWQPYSELDEKTKDADRIWADKILADLEKKKKEVIKDL